MTLGRLLAMGASAVVHAGLVSLAILAAGAGASAVLLVDLVDDTAGDGAGREGLADRGALAPPGPPGTLPPAAPAPKAPAPRERPGSSGSARPAATAPARQPAPSVRAEPESSPPVMVSDAAVETAPTPAVAGPPPAITPSRNAEHPRPEPTPRAQGGESGPATPVAATIDAPSADRSASDRAVERDKAGSREGVSATGPARGAGFGGGTSGAAPAAPGPGGPAVARAGDGDGRGGTPPEYGPYLQRFRRRVQAGLIYPLAARRRGLSGDVELEVLVDPSGRVGSARVVSSSSHAVLDEAALDAVKDVAPEPLPPELPQRALRVRLPLGFRLE